MVEIKKEQCIGCGKCVEDCPVSNIEINQQKAEIKKDCMLCGHCVAICPANAVSIPEYDMADVEDVHMTLTPEAVLGAIKSRRSIRHFQKKQVTREELKLLLQAGRYTATAKNNQDCHFVFVKEELEELKERVWGFIDEMVRTEGRHIAKEKLPYVAFLRRKKADASDDFLFRNAPVVLFITSDWQLDAGLAAQNIEMLAVSMGMGVLYNGFLARIADVNSELKQWLGIEGKEIKACMLIGYPDRTYVRTAPRKKAKVIWR